MSQLTLKHSVRSLLFLSLLVLLIPLSIGANERFVDNGDGTFSDHKLKLMWSQTDNGGDITWENAYRWVKYNFYYLLPGNKYDDWRMPTVEELKTLYVDDESFEGKSTACGVTVKVIPQLDLSCGWVWAAKSSTLSATVFTFRLGYPFSDLKMNKKAHRVLAVRDIKQ